MLKFCLNCKKSFKTIIRGPGLCPECQVKIYKEGFERKKKREVKKESNHGT